MRTTLEQALEALTDVEYVFGCCNQQELGIMKKVVAAISAIESALAAPAQDPPELHSYTQSAIKAHMAQMLKEGWTITPPNAPTQVAVATVIEGHEVDIDGNLINPVQLEYYQDDINNLPVGTNLYTQPKIHAGMTMVPLEPTQAMMDAGMHSLNMNHAIDLDYMAKYCYKAMLQAAKENN